MEEGDAGLLFAADDFDALFDDFLVFVDAAGVFVGVADGFLELLVDFDFVAGFALLGDEIDAVLDFLVGDENALGADKPGGAGG